MQQVVQPVGGGSVRVVDVPRPIAGPTEVLVQTVTSVISAGTERAVTELGRSSLIAKARARPDLVRQVVARARRDGLRRTMRTVQSKLSEDIALGYSACGYAVTVGEAVSGIRPGQLVATAGAGKANHAEYQAVPGLLSVPVPESVTAADAAFATVGAIALHGLRQANVDPGSRIVVVGLGLVGQLTARLALASGYDVAGIDVADFPVERAQQAGVRAFREAGAETTRGILDWSRGRGADAVLLTAASKASDVVQRAPALCRDRAAVVVVGDVGLHLDRGPFYAKELSLRFARSYGPGRYEKSYEEWGVDLPPGFVRWTEGRNLEAVLDLIAAGRLRVDDLVTHRFPVTEAAAAYALVESRREPYLGIQLTYPSSTRADERPIELRGRSTRSSASTPGIGFIGAGAFANSVLVPALTAAGLDRFVAVGSASGLTARRFGQRHGFMRAVSGADPVLRDDDVDLVVIATPHDTHAVLAARALDAGKHVFVEKPLALSLDELTMVEAALAATDRILAVGFNRRWSPAVVALRDAVGSGSGPVVIDYRVSAGTLPPDHWYHDRRQGGRLIGEVCHFVDTCNAIVGALPVSSGVVAGGSVGPECLLAQDLAAVLRYPNGSVASVTYASGGHPTTAKERVEVLGGGHTAVIDDFRVLTVDGRTVPLRSTGKGHNEQMVGLRAMLSGDLAPPDVIGSMRATLELAAQLSGSEP